MPEDGCCPTLAASNPSLSAIGKSNRKERMQANHVAPRHEQWYEPCVGPCPVQETP